MPSARTGLAITVLWTAALPAACGAPDTGGLYAPTGPVAPSAAGAGGGAGGAGSGGIAGAGSATGGAPPDAATVDPVESCKQLAPADPCLVCACERCTKETLDCAADNGCVQIAVCSRQTGCQGTDCYGTASGSTVVPGPCFATINQWGGPAPQGLSATLALTLSTCVTQAACVCQ